MDNDRQDGLLYLDIYMVVAHVGVMVKAKAYGNLVSPTQVPNALATELAKAVVLVSLDILLTHTTSNSRIKPFPVSSEFTGIVLTLPMRLFASRIKAFRSVFVCVIVYLHTQP